LSHFVESWSNCAAPSLSFQLFQGLLFSNQDLLNEAAQKLEKVDDRKPTKKTSKSRQSALPLDPCHGLVEPMTPAKLALIQRSPYLSMAYRMGLRFHNIKTSNTHSAHNDGNLLKPAVLSIGSDKREEHSYISIAQKMGQASSKENTNFICSHSSSDARRRVSDNTNCLLHVDPIVINPKGSDIGAQVGKSKSNKAHLVEASDYGAWSVNVGEKSNFEVLRFYA
jgi:hypothetical protein